MKRIGIITAMNKEMLPIYAQLGDLVGSDDIFSGTVFHYADGDNSYFVATSGIGEILTSATLSVMLERYHLDAVLNFGLVGSLNPNLHIGDLAIVERVVHHQMDLSGLGTAKRGVYDQHYSPYWELPTGVIDRVQNAIPQKLPVVTLASGDEFVSRKATKAALVKEFGADICDMEGAAIAIVSASVGVPVFMLKVVSDNADEKSADEYQNSVERGIYKYKELVGAIASAI